MTPSKKYLSLEEAAEQLGLQPDELIRLREKGEIRGFADRGTWKFKADDVEEFHRRQQPDSDPDLPLLDFGDEIDTPRQKPKTSPIVGMQSDSDVRLVMADDPKKKRLTGSSAEVLAMDIMKSDSDVRLVEAPPASKKGTDSDVKIVKPKSEMKSDSDSDVKMIGAVNESDDSDSDVKLLESSKKLKIDSDSDVTFAKSDSDVRLAPLESDSDVKIIAKKSPERDSDSDVILLSRGDKSGKGSGANLAGSGARAAGQMASEQAPLGDSGITLAGDSGISLSAEDSGIKLIGGDSGIALAGDDSGIKLAGGDSGIRLGGEDSGIRLAGGDSGLRLGGDSGIRLALDSGVKQSQPTDSGISLEGPDSGINLASPSSSHLGGGKKRKGASSKPLKGASEEEDIESTVPMVVPDFDDIEDQDVFAHTLAEGESGDGDLEFNADDTSEMAALTESGQDIVIFDDDETTATPKKKKKKLADDSDVRFDDAEGLEELEVSDEDLSEESEYGDLSFDDEGEALDDSFSEGSSQFEMTAQRKATFVAQEAEWGTGVFTLLLASLCVTIFGTLISADLLRTVWAINHETVVDSGFVSMLTGLWK